jgi:hypothetical protein
VWWSELRNIDFEGLVGLMPLREGTQWRCGRSGGKTNIVLNHDMSQLYDQEQDN